MNRFSEPTRFLIFWGCVAGGVIAGAMAGMDTTTSIFKNLTSGPVFHWRPVEFVKGQEMDWTGRPRVHQVIQRKGTVLRVRSFIQVREEVNGSTAKAVTF